MRKSNNQEFFKSYKKGYCPYCMADSLAIKEIVELDYDTGFCKNCKEAIIEEQQEQTEENK